MSTSTDQYSRLVSVISELRKKCPWDRKQTHSTLVPYLLEEAYETVEAIEAGDMDELREELGDVLLQVLLHSEIASETSAFDIEGVCKSLADKMIHRHPHVFGDVAAADAEAVMANWRKLKQGEKERASALDGIPKALPALQFAQKVSSRAKSEGFDWDDPSGIFDKIAEELAELREAVKSGDPVEKEMELGDLIFSIVNLARHLKVDAEQALRASNRKFESRFRELEKRVKAKGEKPMTEYTLAELDLIWDEIKRNENP